MTESMVVSIGKDVLDAIFDGAKRLWPKETILLLRGKKKRGSTDVTDLVIPPLATYGAGFAYFRPSALPIDFSIVGTAHSHPSGSLNPSTQDLNHMFGSILLVASFPFEDERNVAVYDRRGTKLALQVK